MIYIYNDEDTRDTDATYEIGHNADPYYGFKIYNEMTDENTFIISKNKDKAKKYGKILFNIFYNYDEDTIDDDIFEFYHNLPSDVIVTDPDYWVDHKDDYADCWILTDDNDISYEVFIVGYEAGRL